MSRERCRAAGAETGRLLARPRGESHGNRIADPGEGFDIEKLCHAAIGNPPDSPLQHAIVREEQGLRPGGLGLMMTQSLVDELIYNEARNEVVFIKYLD